MRIWRLITTDPDVTAFALIVAFFFLQPIIADWLPIEATIVDWLPFTIAYTVVGLIAIRAVKRRLQADPGRERGSEMAAPSTEHQRQDARYCSYAACCIAVLLLFGAVFQFATDKWREEPFTSVAGVFSTLAASGYMIHHARQFRDESRQLLSNTVLGK